MPASTKILQSVAPDVPASSPPAPDAPVISSAWTSAGTARSRFAETLGKSSLAADVLLKNKIAPPALPETLQRLRLQFAEMQIGSEYFFQALDWLRWEKSGQPERPVRVEKIYSGKLQPHRTFRFQILLATLLLMRKALISGSTCLPVAELRKQIIEILLNSGFPQADLTNEIANFHFDSPLFVEKKTRSASFLYFQKNWLREQQLLSLLRKRLQMHSKPDSNIPGNSSIQDVLKTVLEEHPVRFGEQTLELAAEQKEAVLSAISVPLLIISGGPGTGKTSVAVTLLRVLKRLGLAEHPVLAAPTGRAAKRIAESVSESLRSLENLEAGLTQLKPEKELLEAAASAKTLHRLLGYHPGAQNFRRHEYDPLEHDLLIIDEASMIDQELMTALMRATTSKLPHRPSVPRLILLGDTQQLPSVGGGAVLAELTLNPETPVRVVRLIRSYRQESGDPAGQNILGVAAAIQAMEDRQQPKSLFETKSPDGEIIRKINNLEDVKAENRNVRCGVSLLNQENSRTQLLRFAQWWVENFLRDKKFLSVLQQEFPLDELKSCTAELDYLFAHLSRFRILTATRVLSTGADALNQRIRELMFPLSAGTSGAKCFFSATEHYPGEPVTVTENIYEKRLFNGDQGIFLQFSGTSGTENPEQQKTELKAVFPIEGGYQSFYRHELHHLQTAYAITVHKSQGSEYDHLALVLPVLNSDPGNKDSGTNRRNVRRGAQELMSREMLYTALTRAKKSVLILGRQKVLETVALHKISRYSGLGAALRNETGTSAADERWGGSQTSLTFL